MGGTRSKLYFIIEFFITIKYVLLTNHDPSINNPHICKC